MSIEWILINFRKLNLELHSIHRYVFLDFMEEVDSVFKTKIIQKSFVYFPDS